MQPDVRNGSQGATIIPLKRPDPGQSAGIPAKPPRLLEQVRQSLRARHYSPRTEKAYVAWIRRFILFHGKRHPETMGGVEVGAFLSSLAETKVSSSTQNQALAALLFLYQQVLGRELEWLGNVVHAKRPKQVPVVLGRQEVRDLLARLKGPGWPVCSLLYGAGLRLLEALRLRVKDVDFDRRELIVRRGKGGKDRRTVLPAVSVEHRRKAAPSPARNRDPARRTASRQRNRHRQTREPPYPSPLVRHPPARGRLRHSHHPRIARPPRRQHHHDLFTHVLNRGGLGVRSPLDR
jgi:integrase